MFYHGAVLWGIAAIITLNSFVLAESPCSTPDGKNGDCKSIEDCEPLQTMLAKEFLTQSEIKLLKSSACGFMANMVTPKVCCPIVPDTTCTTPEFIPGQCVSISNCEHIKNRLSSCPVTEEDFKYVLSIRCPSSKDEFNVCCETSPNPSECTLAATPPHPSSGCCGYDGAGPNKIYGGNATGIDQYPWLALIEYKQNDKIKLLCGGALISGRYVLTAAHCVVGVHNFGTPTNVRLGEYNVTNSGKDCVPVEGDPGEEDCTDGVTVIPIERIIPHPDYKPRSSWSDDIAMLRMAQMAPYSDFIRPICLPTTDRTLEFKKTTKLFAAGWGAVTDKIWHSDVKMHVDLPYKTLEVCQAAYNRGVTLWEKQVCAGGESGKDTCKGDSGGPLMYATDTFYEVIGIVSFGPVSCGLENFPAVFTKVFGYINWIHSNIEP